MAINEVITLPVFRVKGNQRSLWVIRVDFRDVRDMFAYGHFGSNGPLVLLVEGIALDVIQASNRSRESCGMNSRTLNGPPPRSEFGRVPMSPRPSRSRCRRCRDPAAPSSTTCHARPAPASAHRRALWRRPPEAVDLDRHRSCPAVVVLPHNHPGGRDAKPGRAPINLERPADVRPGADDGSKSDMVPCPSPMSESAKCRRHDYHS